MIPVIHAPNRVPAEKDVVFLAGTIDMGNSVNWQELASVYINEVVPPGSYHDNSLVIANPRRPDWDSTQEQSITNPYFYQQVDWELKNLERARFIIYYLEKDSKSPITLLELGSFAKRGNCVVVCEEGFYRKGNVDIFCDQNRITQVETLKGAIEHLFKRS